MKKEFSTLIQFIIIAGLVAVFFGFAIAQQYSESISKTNNIWIKYWIYSFITLSAIRFGVYFIIFRKAFVEANQSLIKVFLSELSKSFQYFIIAVFSTYAVFQLFIENNLSPKFSYDLISIWDNIRDTSGEWLVAFAILSLLRLGIILIWNYLLQKRRALEV